VETIDAFFERHETPGYKFDIDSKGNVFIVEMEGAEHTSVIGLLIGCFIIPNGGIITLNSPIKVEINSGKNHFGCLIFGCNQFYNLLVSYNSPLSSTRKRVSIVIRSRHTSKFKHYSKTTSTSTSTSTPTSTT